MTHQPPTDWNELGKAVLAAEERITPFVLRTPLLRAEWLDGPESEVWIKLECWQKTGSFKARGAYNALALTQPDVEIFTGSAGNHGLAIATAAMELGRRCLIVVPESASELKLRRIRATGAQVVPVGRDLFESAAHARCLAVKGKGRFVSAFGDWDVVAGGGTCAVECLREQPDVTSFVVPLGGGGLTVGVAGAIAASRKSAKVFAIHPELFGRRFTPGNVCRELRTTIVPTIADGLAVQVDDDYDVATRVEAAVADIWSIPEDQIKIGITAMLHLEGILLEGAGAIGIAALMDPDRAKYFRGTVIVLATGRNVSSSDVGHALGAPVRDPRVRELLGLRHIRPSVQLAAAPNSASRTLHNGHGTVVASAHTSVDWTKLLQSLDNDVERLFADLQHHRKYQVTRELRVDSMCGAALDAQAELCASLAREFSQSDGPTWAKRARYRLLLQQIAHLQTCLQWASPSQDQSLETAFFDPAEQATSSVNYARYGTVGLRTFELSLRDALGFDSRSQELLAASSGMAAYQVFEAFLLRNVLRPGECVGYAPYIYFEAQEQMQRLPGYRHVSFSSYCVETILTEVAREDPRVIFLDPLANCAGMPTIDFHEIANRTRDGSWKDRWLVIDGTMVSGGFNPFQWFDSPVHPRILYYESASKYLQLGMDLQMAGVCVFDAGLFPDMFLYRRNSGSSMYSIQVARFPRYTRETLLGRMRLLSRNAGLIAASLHRISDRVGGIMVGFPGIAAEELGWDHAGGVVAVEFCAIERNNRASLELYIEMLLAECRTRGVPLTRGVSFGFGVTRVSAASAMAESTDPFLRFAAGEETEKEMEVLCECIEAACFSFAECETH
jgi:threonine dehydratase